MTKKVGLLLGPTLFFVILFAPPPTWLSFEAWKVIGLALFMLTWWVTESVSLSVTALLPIVCLPLLGIDGIDIKTATAPYSNHIVFLFMGGFMIALAMEKWQLHRRIALNIVNLTGTNANGIILGFMLATALLSMWISNTATTIMMLPIALSVIDLLKSNNIQYPEKGMHHFALSMMIGIAYAANIGGTTTIIGTPPTVVFSGFINETYGQEVSFANWFMIGFPFATVMLFCSFWVLVKWLYKNNLGNLDGAQQLIEQELNALGPMSRGEVLTFTVFITTALFWIFRSFINQWIPGFSITDSGIAMLSSVALFVIPVDWKNFRFVLEWRDTHKLAWGILLLFGGGLSLAGALDHVGIISSIGDQFQGTTLSIFFILLGLTAVSLFLTEIMSNLALVVVFLPVVGGIAQGLGEDPVFMCIPVTLAASCAFMLPMSTPPNAIVFASGYLKVSQMAKAGIFLNIITILLISLMAQTLLPYIMGTH